MGERSIIDISAAAGTEDHWKLKVEEIPWELGIHAGGASFGLHMEVRGRRRRLGVRWEQAWYNEFTGSG